MASRPIETATATRRITSSVFGKTWTTAEWQGGLKALRALERDGEGAFRCERDRRQGATVTLLRDMLIGARAGELKRRVEPD